MSIENAKNYTGSEDVYRNMNKANYLLERALGLLEGSHYQDVVEEIRAYLSEPKKEPLNLNCKSVQKRLVTQWGYSISGKRDPLREEDIEVVAESASTELVGSSKMEHTTEPVAFLYDLDAYCDHKPDENVLSKKLPKGLLARHIKNIRPLYARPAPKREPLSDFDVCEGYVTTIKEEPWTRIKAYFAGVRFAEKYHEIGGEDV